MEQTPPLRRIDEDLSDLEDLAPGQMEDFRVLDPSVRFLWVFGRLIFWGMVTVFGLLAWFLRFLSGAYLGPWPLIALASLAFVHVLWPFVSYHHWGYAIRRHDLLIRSGVIWKRLSAIPFSRIQHVDSGAGPLERSLGIANVVIHTAGANMGSLSIPGLYVEDAEALRDFLSEVGHTHANI